MKIFRFSDVLLNNLAYVPDLEIIREFCRKIYRVSDYMDIYQFHKIISKRNCLWENWSVTFKPKILSPYRQSRRQGVGGNALQAKSFAPLSPQKICFPESGEEKGPFCPKAFDLLPEYFTLATALLTNLGREG